MQFAQQSSSARRNLRSTLLSAGLGFVCFATFAPVAADTVTSNQTRERLCQAPCVIIEPAGEYSVVTAISANGNGRASAVVKAQAPVPSKMGQKCLAKSDCIIDREPDHSTCGVTRINCVEVYERDSYDIIVSWRGIGLDPQIEIQSTEGDDEEEESDDE